MPDWSRYAELNTRLGGPVEDFQAPSHWTRKQLRSMGRVSQLAVRAAEIALADAGLDSFDAVRRWYTAGPREMRSFVGDGPLLTDDRPLVEYHRSLPTDGGPLDLSTLRGPVEELEVRSER